MTRLNAARQSEAQTKAYLEKLPADNADVKTEEPQMNADGRAVLKSSLHPQLFSGMGVSPMHFVAIKKHGRDAHATKDSQALGFQQSRMNSDQFPGSSYPR